MVKLSVGKQRILKKLQYLLEEEGADQFVEAAQKILIKHANLRGFAALSKTLHWVATGCSDREMSACYNFLSKYPKHNKFLENIVNRSSNLPSGAVVDNISLLFDKRGTDVYDKALEKIAEEASDWRDIKPAIKLFYKYPIAKEIAKKITEYDVGAVENDQYFSFFDDEVIKVLKQYKNRDPVYDVLYEQVAEGITKATMKKVFFNVFADKEVAKIIEKHGKNANYVADCLFTLCKETFRYVPNEEATNVFKNYYGKQVRRIADLFKHIHGDKSGLEVSGFAKLLERYDYAEYIIDVAEEKCAMFEEEHYQMLMRDKAYGEISTSKNPIELINNILSKNYTEVQKKIYVDLSFKDLDEVMSTHNFVEQVHKERMWDALEKISDGFYLEMNRAIAQADSYDAKVKNVRTYCREVRERIKENIGDLMVVTNA